MAFMQQLRGFKFPGGERGNLAQLGQDFNIARKPYGRSYFAPAYTLSALYQSPEAQAYLNPAELASTMGVESALAGRQTLGRQAGMGAQQQGLGPGFAMGMEQQATQQAFADIAQMLQEAQLLQQERQFGAARDLASTVQEGQRAKFMRNQSRRANKQGSGGLVGGAGGAGIGALIGTIAMPGIGTAIGAGMGGQMGGSIGQSVDQMQGRFSPAPNFSSLMMLPFLQGLGGGGGMMGQQAGGQSMGANLQFDPNSPLMGRMGG